jgi:hypothetical protein
MAAKKDKAKSKIEARLAQPTLFSADPWLRMPRGAALRQAIERGHALDAIWMLDDGVIPDAESLGEALCSAAWQGQRELCLALMRKGAKVRFKALGVDLSLTALKTMAWEARHGPAAQALCGGHWALAQEIAARLGERAWGDGLREPDAYAWLASRSKLSGPSRAPALSRAREEMSTKNLALAGALLACQGCVQEVGELLDDLKGEPALPAVAEAMAAALASYGPGETGRPAALAALAKVAQACPRPGPGLALWDPADRLALSHWSEGNPGERRFEQFESAAGESWREAAARAGRVIWPRASAVFAQNEQALALFSQTPWSKEEVGALELMGRKALAGLDQAAARAGNRPGALEASAWFLRQPLDESRETIPGGYRAREAALAALALAEAKSLEACSNDASKAATARQKKEAKEARSRGEPAVDSAPARRPSRL